jgi:hypothetical protein
VSRRDQAETATKHNASKFWITAYSYFAVHPFTKVLLAILYTYTSDTENRDLWLRNATTAPILI